MHDLGTIPDANGRAPGADSIGHIEVSTVDFLIAPGKFVNGSDDVIYRPKLAVVSVA